MRLSLLLVAVAALLSSSCTPTPATPPATAKSGSFRVQSWPLPTGAGAAHPDFSRAPDGSFLLSWVEPGEAGDVLRFSRYAKGEWSAAREIARGDGIGSAVETPHLRASADGALWAQWLRKPQAAGHARDVVFTRSADAGAHWSAPTLLNLDGTHTEHGFVAMWPTGDSGMGIAWLDGRATHPVAHGAGAHAGAGDEGATMLRAANFDAALVRSGETTVDAMSCDCCQTDVATTARGPLLVYRDRAPGEVRDIAVSRLEAGIWTAPALVHADGWIMSACPVNGPALAADGESVAAAWFTSANGQPSVRLALSSDSGSSFAAPLRLEMGAGVVGHVDVAMDRDAAWVSWLVEDARGQSLRLARLDRASGRVESREVAHLQSRGLGAGIPRLVLEGGRVHLVWTDAADTSPALHALVVSR